jgi:hypothetical protein
MVRNIMGCLVAVGSGRSRRLDGRGAGGARSRDAAAPTFAPDGLYFLGPYYDAEHGRLWTTLPAMDWLPMNRPHPHQDLRPDREADVDDAIDAGADALGFVLYPPRARAGGAGAPPNW